MKLIAYFSVYLGLVATQFAHAEVILPFRNLRDTVSRRQTSNSSTIVRFVSKMSLEFPNLNVPSFCLEATEVRLLVLRKCSSGNDFQKWKMDEYGRFRSVGYPKMCMGANRGNTFLKLIDCGSDQWSDEDIIPIMQFLYNCLDSSIRSVADANQVLTVRVGNNRKEHIIHLTKKEYDSPFYQQWEIEYMTSTSTPVVAKQRTFSELDFPLSSPISSPTVSPTESPTESPTVSPTESPTKTPTESPTESPTVLLTQSPTILPTQSLNLLPTSSSSIVCLDDHSIRVAVNNFINNPKHSMSVDGPIESWKTCDVTHVEGLFEKYNSGAQHFNEYIGRWDVSRVQSLKYTFYEAYAFNGDISQWQVSSVTAMDETFFEANSFNIDISEWDVSSVESMYATFFGAEKFNADISGWDISSLTSTYGAFVSADSFNINLSAWNIEKVEVMSMMFYGAASFSQRLCWNVNGKDTFLMFARTSASISGC